MRKLGSIIRQSVGSASSSYREVLSSLRASQPSSCELVVQRDDQVLRYSSEEPALVYQELWYQAALEAQVAEPFAVLYDALFQNELIRCIAVFNSGMCVYDGPSSDYPAIRMPGLNLFYVDEGINLGDIEAKFLDCSGVDKEALFTTNVKIRLGQYKKYYYIALAVVMCLGAALSVYKYFDKEQVVVVKEVEIVEIDPYRDYREYVRKKQTFDGLAQAFQVSDQIVRSLPSGWTSKTIELANGTVRADVLYSGGSYIELANFRDSLGPAGQYFHIDGQIAWVEVPILAGKDGSAWSEKLAPSDVLRDALLSLWRMTGVSVRTKLPESKGLFSTQLMEISSTGSSVLTVLEAMELLSSIPVFVNSVSLERGATSDESKMVIVLEVVGE